MDRQMSARKATKVISERLQSLEDGIPQIIQGINGAFGQMNNQVSSLQELAEALTELVGKDQVTDKVTELRLRHATEQADAQKAGVADSLAKGELVLATTISEKTILVAAEFDKDGKVFGAGRVQTPAANLKPEFKEQLMGKGAGASFELPNGGKFVVNEIYDVVEKAPTAPEIPAACSSCSEDCASCPGHDAPPPAPSDKA